MIVFGMAGSKRPLIAVFIHPAKNTYTQLENVTLHDGWQQIPGFLILRTTLHGPGWSLVTLYPRHGNLHNRILKYPSTNPLYVVSIGVTMTSALLVTTSLTDTPLWRFVDVINKHHQLHR